MHMDQVKTCPAIKTHQQTSVIRGSPFWVRGTFSNTPQICLFDIALVPCWKASHFTPTRHGNFLRYPGAPGGEWKLPQPCFITSLFCLLILSLIPIFLAHIFALRDCNVTLVRMTSFLTHSWPRDTSAWENTNNEPLLTVDIYAALAPFAASLGDF